MNELTLPSVAWISLSLIGAYLLGSVSFAVVSSKIFGLADPRSYGSGNPGATNVLRSGNTSAAILTLIGDLFKGLLAVLLANTSIQRYGLPDYVPALAGLAAFLGHLYPVFHRFQGGKGVATAAGVLIGLNWILGLAVGATWAIIFFFFRVSSLAALIAALSAVFFQMLWLGFRLDSLAVLLMSALLIYRHKENISRLISGQESKMKKN